ncbi:MAG TPA: asparagine synthase (glutamine-hydrolyzing) [Candidatus Acidoferrum sp.]|nr:asparagine synthase (glutamine-hydrolyzing) [Candidatus Acidoferrum sp.]
MCGICGALGIESKETSEAIVRRMLASIVHRGPDEEGLLVSPRVAVGTRRLSIIDLPGGNQPIWNEAGTLAVVFNGEIYNFRGLRPELESMGHRFRTQSDTEAIVHAYEAWGADCVQHLDGMFAFAIVELPQGRGGRSTKLFLARDRLGIKPLYYALIDGNFYFASEVRALIAGGCVPPRISAGAVPSYLLFGSVAEPSTFIEHVFSLPPGHAIGISADRPVGSVEPRPYWRPRFDAGKAISPQPPTRIGPGPAKQVRVLLEKAVESHLVADVPVGVFLSSGIDSTTIAALASRAQKGIHTFTVAFPEAEFSEAEIARRTARTLGTNHSEVSISGQEMVSRLDQAIAAFDQPTMDGVNTYFVSWAAREAGLKVALSGLGSDELFGGYNSFRATRQIAGLARAARILPRTALSLTANAVNRAKSSRHSRDAVRKAFAAWCDPDLLPHPYFFTRLLFTPQTALSGMNETAAEWESLPWARWLSLAVEQTRDADPFTAVSWLELRSYLLSTLLRDTDAMSMRHSLEVRVPFLDSALVEYALSLPESAKRKPVHMKALLVEAVGDLLPPEIVAQPKRTFTFPWEIWLHGDLGKRVSGSLADWSPALEAHIRPEFPLSVWKDFLRGRTTWSRPWSLYVLNEWVRRHVDFDRETERPNAAAVTAA